MNGFKETESLFGLPSDEAIDRSLAAQDEKGERARDIEKDDKPKKEDER